MGASTDIVVGGELARAATGRYMATGWQCGRVWQEPLILTTTNKHRTCSQAYKVEESILASWHHKVRRYIKKVKIQIL